MASFDSTAENITTLSATEIAQKIMSGSICSREVVEAHIQRIEAVNSRLNGVIEGNCQDWDLKISYWEREPGQGS